MPLTSISVAIPKYVFQRSGGFKPHLKLGEDFDLWIRIALSHQVAFLDEPLAYYFQDSNPTWRGTGHLTDPKVHMLWNLDYLSEEEKKNPDYKQLIDNLSKTGVGESRLEKATPKNPISFQISGMAAQTSSQIPKGRIKNQTKDYPSLIGRYRGYEKSSFYL